MNWKEIMKLIKQWDNKIQENEKLIEQYKKDAKNFK